MSVVQALFHRVLSFRAQTTDQIYNDFAVGDGSSLTFDIFSSGGVQVSGLNSGIQDSFSWITPAPPTETYYVNVTPVVGSFTSGAATSTWLSLASSRSWTIAVSAGNEATIIFDVSIATDSGGTNVVATGQTDFAVSGL